MIAFNTEMEIALPTEKEADYLENVKTNVEKFLGTLPDVYKESINLTYNSKGRKNVVSFKWNDSLYPGDEEGEDRVIAASLKMEYWFKHCKWFRKHNVMNFCTSYLIKG